MMGKPSQLTRQPHNIMMNAATQLDDDDQHQEVVVPPNRLVYKLHPTFVVLRSQQLNIADAMNPNHEADNQNTESRLVPDYSVPIQIVTPDNSTVLGSRYELVSREQPTVLPHTHQQNDGDNEEMSGEEQLRRHVETTQQQQQSLFTGPFLLYRTPARDHKFVKRLQVTFYVFAVIDIFVLTYLYFGVRYFPFLSNIPILEMFGIHVSQHARSTSLARIVLEPIQFFFNLLINGMGCWGALKKDIRLLTIFIVSAMVCLIIDMLTFISLLAIVQIFIEVTLVTCATGIRSKLLYTWYTTNQF